MVDHMISEPESGGRTIVIGDVHGCLAELRRLLIQVQWVPGQDRVILTGDLTDRGPDPKGTIDFCREQGFECVYSNHEAKHVEWRKRVRAEKDGRPNNMQPFLGKRLAEHESYTDDDIEWMDSRPPFVKFTDAGRPWLVVHAGFSADRPYAEQDRDSVARLRYLDEKTGAVKAGRTPREAPEGSVLWTSLWKGPESVISGHIVVKSPTFEKTTTPGVQALLIDTGCCFGKKLTAAVFEGFGVPRLESVDAYANHFRAEKEAMKAPLVENWAKRAFELARKLAVEHAADVPQAKTIEKAVRAGRLSFPCSDGSGPTAAEFGHQLMEIVDRHTPIEKSEDTASVTAISWYAGAIWWSCVHDGSGSTPTHSVRTTRPSP